MSLNSRIKERREQLNMSRIELANKIGVTPSAIANYENDISSPKVELLYKLFDALQCDANYLYQDETKELTYKDKATPEEFERIIKKYRKLDAHGKEMVDFTLDKEWERSAKGSKVLEMPAIQELKASHKRTDIEVTAEMRKHDNDIMSDENF